MTLRLNGHDQVILNDDYIIQLQGITKKIEHIKSFPDVGILNI